MQALFFVFFTFFITFAAKKRVLTLYMYSAYLAPISCYSRWLRKCGTTDESPHPDYWQKQTLRNRCHIDSPSGALTLTIPVVHPQKGALTDEVLISEHGDWRHRHWNALCSSYRQTPFFDYYEEDFHPFYHEHRWEHLAEFNTDLQAVIVQLLFPNGTYHLNAQPRTDEYHQMFAVRHGFLSDLSIVDLLFNMGPEAVFWL